MSVNNDVKELMNDATLISYKLPKCKTVYVSKDIRNKLNLKNGQFVYLIINNLIHPVVFHTSIISFPKIMKKSLHKSRNIKIYIKLIENKELLFLSSFLPVNVNKKIDYYNLPIHKLIDKKTKLKIFCEDKYFYVSSGRNRVNFSKRSLKKLGFKPLKVYQFLVRETSEIFDNKFSIVIV